MTLKTRKGVKKRVKVTWKGKFKLGQAWNKHLLSNKSKKSKEKTLKKGDDNEKNQRTITSFIIF